MGTAQLPWPGPPPYPCSSCITATAHWQHLEQLLPLAQMCFLAGTPTTVSPAETSLVTTAPAPT